VQHIFEPFFTTKKNSGTGLGLSTVFGIVQTAGGWIEVESEPGVGTTFSIYFPPAEGAVFASLETKPASDRKGTETILLVEDEASLRALTHGILKECGYTVLIAASGQEAQEVAARHAGEIELILTDVIMPGMSGPEVAESMTAHRPGIKVLYTSGYTDDPRIQAALSHSPHAFLQKPFAPQDLTRKVREVLDSETLARGMMLPQTAAKHQPA